MSKKSFGPEVQRRTRVLYEALLKRAIQVDFALDTKFKINWVSDTELNVDVKRTTMQGWSKLKDDQVREALHHLKDTLCLMVDNRAVTRGSETWRFKLIAPHRKNLDENLRELDRIWDAKRTDRSRDYAQLSQKGQLPVSEELQSLTNFLGPINDFFSPIDEIVKRAYRSSLREGRDRPIPQTCDALLQQLAETPGETGKPKPLLQFVNFLIQDPSLDASRREKLKVWGQEQGLSYIASSSVLQPEIVETCLMVKVQPRPLKDPSQGFLISAAIVEDSDPRNIKVEPIPKAIAVPDGTDPKYAPGYSEEDLPAVLSHLITSLGAEYSLKDLTVQCFLPLELMSLPIEHWQIQIGRHQMQCYGQRLKAVIVRSYDRHFSRYYKSVLGDWREYWRRLLESPDSHCRDCLMHWDPMVGGKPIDWSSQTVIGCRFVEHDDPQAQVDFWDRLLSQGLPIAIWKRQPETDRTTAETEIQSVTDCLLADLSKSVKSYRQRSTVSISLLWDNPFRPFPDINYQSA